MKKSLFVLTLFLFTASVILLSCKGDEGPIGPQGAAGAQGTSGTAGTAGPKGDKGDAGTANVIYSAWLEIPKDFCCQ